MRATQPSALALCALLLACAGARANDSEAELALGGLTLTRSADISMDSEDLFISRERVRVKYRFTNHSDGDIETLVAFPLPDLPPAEEGDRFWGDAAHDLAFRTQVDGKPLALTLVEQAMFKAHGITARLAALHLPINHHAEGFSGAVNRLTKEERDRLVSEGLLRDAGMSNEQLWDGLWSVHSTVTRTQRFPAKQTITVEHDYSPLAGGSVGGGLDPARRKGEDAKYFAEKRRQYCIDNEWLTSFDALLKKRGKDVLPYSEVWLGYVLKTGANWKGPISDFRLVIDKGKPDSLVSFCSEGVKKISPTQFEIYHANYTPTDDLRVLIVDWPNVR